MASTLKTTIVQEPSSAVNNLTLDTSGGVTVGQNLSVSGTASITGATTFTTNVTSSGTVVMSSPYTMRNKIINGAMVIDQRNAGASVTPASAQYTLDRWTFDLSLGGKLTCQQNAGSVTPPSGFTNYLGITSSSAYSITSGDYFALKQFIEGFNIADLSWGTASAVTVTLSFWVRSSLTGTFGGCFANATNNRAYPFTYTISSANTWEQKSITVTGDTGGTWLTNNSVGIEINFGLGVGSTYSGTAGSWSANNYLSATGATSVVGTNGATFYITGVQLERGTVATPFEYRNYQQELAMCQRYFYKTTPAWRGVFQSTTTAYRVGGIHPVTMRTSPSLTVNTSLSVFDGTNIGTTTSIAVNYSTTDVGEVDLGSLSTTFVAGRPVILYQSGTGSLSVSAEL